MIITTAYLPPAGRSTIRAFTAPGPVPRYSLYVRLFLLIMTRIHPTHEIGIAL
jgi:hypothetical protein